MCLARTLVTGPNVLLLDEPTSALDGAATRLLERHARAVADDGVPVVWVTHDLQQAERLADEVVVLWDGHVADDDERHRFLSGPTADEPATTARTLTSPGAGGVAASLVLVAVAVVLSVRQGLGVERTILWAAARALVQLLIVGSALTLVLDDDAPVALAVLWVVAMVAIASVTIHRRAPEVAPPRCRWAWWRWAPPPSCR